MSKKKPYSLSILRSFLFKTFLIIGLFAFGKMRSQCSLGLFATNNPVNCLTSMTSATVSVFGATGAVSFTWLPTGGSASVAVGLTPNSYTILAKDALGCLGNTNLVILNSSGISLSVFGSPVTCYGGNDGFLVANVTGSPSYPLTYSWTPSAPNSATVNNVPAGGYTLLVTDAVSCTFSTTALVTQPPTYTSSIASKTINCNGALSGATVNVSGGTPPYTYSWSPTASTSSVMPNIPAGSYTVLVKDASNCTITPVVNITQPPVLSASLNIININCNGNNNGQAFALVSGGTPAYTYTWLPGATNLNNLNNLAPGSYTLIAKDTKSCTVNQTFNITQPAALAFTTSHTDEFCVNSDGTATVLMSGGTAPYSYSWTTMPAQTTATATGLAAGTYSVFVNDVNGCKTTAVVTVGNLSNLVGKIITKTDVSCFAGCNGTATAGITGGTAPYSYNWPSIPSGSLASVSNLCAGTYSVKITDNFGCYTYTSVVITEPPVLTFSISGVNKICNGQSSTLTATAAGGTPAYTYSWMPGNLNGSSVTVSPVSTTGYSLTVKDANGCSGPVKVFSVTVNPPLTLNAGANSLTVCPNVNTPITVSVTGGDGNYSYNWQPGNLNTSNINVNVTSSTVYTVSISDGCGSTPISSNVNVTVYSTTAPTFTSTTTKGCEPLCVQFTNLTPSVTSAYWSFGDYSTPVVSPAATHCYTKAGLYSINLITTDAKGCKSSLIMNNYITVYGKPKADFIYSPENVDLNSPEVLFTNTSINSNQISWTMGDDYLGSQQKMKYTFHDVGCYRIKLTVTNTALCNDTTSRLICVTEGFNFWAPNAFSPDEDEMNEIFIPKGTGWDENNYTFFVMDRWGNTVFKTHSIYEGWNGKYGGSKATDEIYVWKVQLTDLYDTKHEYTGKVALLR